MIFNRGIRSTSPATYLSFYIAECLKEMLPNAEVFPLSAKEHFNVPNLMARIVELLPPSPPYFGKDALTDKPARFFEHAGGVGKHNLVVGGVNNPGYAVARGLRFRGDELPDRKNTK